MALYTTAKREWLVTILVTVVEVFCQCSAHILPTSTDFPVPEAWGSSGSVSFSSQVSSNTSLWVWHRL